MAEQSGLPKPGDLFIGVIDFFAILVPGVLAAMFVAWVRGLIPAQPDTLFFGTLLLTGFILGHILHGIGSFLDVLIYNPFFRPLDPFDAKDARTVKEYFRANDELYHQAKGVTALPGTGDPNASGNGNDARVEYKSPPGGMYQWARAWLRMRSPEATAELDRLEADSKLFRSLTVIALAVFLCWKMFPHVVAYELPLTISALLFSLWRYCDLRQKMVRACYLHYVQVRSEAAEVVHQRQ
jgi:hypothetical protein